MVNNNEAKQTGKKFDNNEIFAFDVADALKRYLRYLVDPLFPGKMHDKLMETKADPKKLFEVLKDLPEINRNCIKLLFQFLVKVRFENGIALIPSPVKMRK